MQWFCCYSYHCSSLMHAIDVSDKLVSECASDTINFATIFTLAVLLNALLYIYNFLGYLYFSVWTVGIL